MEQEVWGGFSASATQLAARDVETIRREHTGVLDAFPVQPELLARRLDIPVELSAPARGRAQLRISSQPPRFSISIDPKLGVPTRRFAVAHEIGHAILFGRHPEIAREFESDSRERYADHFAASLLIPPAVRPDLGAVIRVAERPRELLALAARFGISPSAFLRIASGKENLFHGSDTIWLRVKYLPNPATGSQPRLRVISAHYDRTQFFVPRYISLRSLCGDEWLAMLSAGGEAELSEVQSMLSLVNVGHSPKYTKKPSNTRLRGIRLSASDHDRIPYYIVTITVLDRHGAPSRSFQNALQELERLLPFGDEPDVVRSVVPAEDVQLALW